MTDTLHNPQATLMQPQVKTWDELAKSAYHAFYKRQGIDALPWICTSPGVRADWLAVVHQLWAEYVALRALTHRQFHLPDAPAQEDSLAIVAWGNHPKAAL